MTDQTLPSHPRFSGHLEQARLGDRWVVTSSERFGHVLVDDAGLEALQRCDGSRPATDIHEELGPSAQLALEDAGRADLLESDDAEPRPTVRVTSSGVEARSGHRPITWLYRSGAWVALTRSGGMVLAALVVSAATVLAVSSPPGSPTAMARGLSVILGLVVLTAVHEVGHALVIVHAGRRVGPVGVGFYWGSISTYVDATDALLLPRRRRVLQAAAGCIAELGFVAALVLMAEVVGSPTVHWIVRDLVTLVVIDVLINLVPFLELDGYWILTDVLDRPRLRAEARSALRSPVRPGLAAYWIGSTVFGFVLLVGAAVGWWNRFGDVVHDLWFGSSVERVLSVLLVAPLVAPVVLAPLQLLAGRGGSPFDEPPP